MGLDWKRGSLVGAHLCLWIGGALSGRACCQQESIRDASSLVTQASPGGHPLSRLDSFQPQLKPEKNTWLLVGRISGLGK